MIELQDIQGPLTENGASAVRYWENKIATRERTLQDASDMAGTYATLHIARLMTGTSTYTDDNQVALGLARLAAI